MTMTNKELAQRIKQDIDTFCISYFDNDHRNHLGASVMGKKCDRQIWYGFRWVKKEAHGAQRLRLFNRGHREEPQMSLYLRGIGCIVSEFDTTLPQNPDGSYPQYRVSGCEGHFGGSLDAIVTLPERYNIPDPMPFSYKTNGTGQKFNNLSTQGLLLAKPEHHVQESIYSYKMGFNLYGYMNVNKNDDSLFIDIQKADHKEAQRQEERAHKIIFSKVPPARISEHRSYQECSYCHLQGVCHDAAPIEKNCRSCMYSDPVAEGKWFCGGYQSVIPGEVIRVGCGNWSPVVNGV